MDAGGHQAGETVCLRNPLRVRQPVFGLPGNPVSAMVSFELLVGRPSAAWPVTVRSSTRLSAIAARAGSIAGPTGRPTSSGPPLPWTSAGPGGCAPWPARTRTTFWPWPRPTPWPYCPMAKAWTRRDGRRRSSPTPIGWSSTRSREGSGGGEQLGARRHLRRRPAAGPGSGAMPATGPLVDSHGRVHDDLRIRSPTGATCAASTACPSTA